MAQSDGWYILTPSGSTGFTGAVVYHATGTEAVILHIMEDSSQPAIIGGKNWTVSKGPYPSEDAADQVAGGKLPVLSGAIKAGTPPTPGLGNPLASVGNGIDEIGHVLDATYHQVTKISMWRSLGWILLGSGLIGLGGFWLAKSEGEKAIGSIVSTATTGKIKKPGFGSPVLGLIVIMTGLYLVWFSVHYWEDTKTIWPSDPLKAILQGKPMPPRAADSSALSQLSNVSGQSSGKSGTPAPSGNVQKDALSLFKKHGWSANQFPALQKLWTRESGWNPLARNPQSGAFGIAQALGHGDDFSRAPDGTNEYGGYGITDSEARQANEGNAMAQEDWGEDYIATTYGNPDNAWSHEESAGWY